MGRSRDIGDERWATVTETAEALGVTGQAIYNRIRAKTIPFDEQIDPTTGRHSYRINRDWLDAELARRERMPEDSRELDKQMSDRTEEIMLAFAEGVETIRREVERQHTQLVPLTKSAVEEIEAAKANQIRMLGTLEKIQVNQSEAFKVVRRAAASMEETDRKETEFQRQNLELQRENLEIQRRLLAALDRAEAAEEQRRQSGQAERRSFWRRLFH